MAPQNRILIFNLVDQTSCGTPMANALIMGNKLPHNLKLCVGTFRNVAICSMQVTVVNKQIRPRYYAEWN